MMNLTLENVATATVALFAAAATLWIIGEMAKRRMVQLNEQDIVRERFFRVAEQLVDDPATSTEVIDFIKQMSLLLASRTILWRFVFHVIAGRTRNENGGAFEAYKALPPHLGKAFVGALIAAIFALTYNNMMLGTLIRRLMLYSVSSKLDGDISSARPAAMMADELAHSGVQAAA